MTPAAFYASLGSPFGRSAAYGPSFHAGQDYPWRIGTAIPAFAKGRVVAKGKTSDAGYYVVLLIGGRYFLFYHMREASPLSVGDDVDYGDTMGRVGATGKTTGGHLHLAASTSPIPGQGTRVNPVPLVAKYLQARLASEDELALIPEILEGVDMPAVIKRTDGTPEWSLVAPGLAGSTPLERGYVVTTDPKRALWWERFYEKGFGTADAFGRTEYVAAQAIARLDHAAWLAGQPTSPTPAIDYAALAERVKVPTADEVAKAVVRELKLPGN